MNIGGIRLFKEFDRGDGICKYLDLNTNLCEIYSERPVICNVDKAYDMYFASVLSKEEYYKMNYDICNQLKIWHKRNVTGDRDRA